jgi:hypothetical protein
MKGDRPVSSLWAQFPDSFEMCKKCVGTGNVRCSPCSGTGGRYQQRYDRDYDGRPISRSEWVSCGSCGGSGNGTCPPCGGSGSIQKSSTTAGRRRREAAAEETYDSVQPAVEEQSEAELWEEMYDGRLEILDDISKCERFGLPFELAAWWSGRLENIEATSPEAEAELKTLEADVKRFSEDCVSAFEMDDDDERLVSKLSLIEASLDLLSKQSSQYQRRFSSRKPQPPAQPAPAVKPTLREEMAALAESSGPEAIVECPGCHTKMKAKKLLLHFDKKHWWKENGTA